MENLSIADYSGLSGIPIASFTPTSIVELAQYLKANPEASFRIGAGLSGVSGGAVPMPHEHFINLSKLTNISWFDQRAGVLSCEAGTTMRNLLDFVHEGGWDFPVIPGSLDMATVGGMIACNGGGPLTLKFGKIGNYVLSMDILTASGESIIVGGKANKISQGISDKHLWIGSEGSLGIVTNVLLRCIPKLSSLTYYRIAGDSLGVLIDYVPALLKFDPYILELASKEALNFTSKVNEHVLWVAFNNDPEIPKIKDLRVCKENESIIAERFGIGHNLQTYKPFIDLDVSFPLKYASKGILEVRQLLEKHHLEHIVFGHAGDGNYHIHLFFNGDEQQWEAITEAFNAIIIKYEGAFSGEHGIGRIHQHRFNAILPSWNQKVYTALKTCLDPKGQLPSLI
jgi:glycolate oxidase